MIYAGNAVSSNAAIGATGLTATQAPPQVQTYLAELSGALAAAENELAHLEQRLAPVMRPNGPDGSGEQIPSPSCPMAADIDAMARRARHLTNNLRQIGDRLEV